MYNKMGFILIACLLSAGCADDRHIDRFERVIPLTTLCDAKFRRELPTIASQHPIEVVYDASDASLFSRKVFKSIAVVKGLGSDFNEVATQIGFILNGCDFTQQTTVSDGAGRFSWERMAREIDNKQRAGNKELFIKITPEETVLFSVPERYLTE